MTPSWYDLLDVDRSASPEEIRAAWRAGTAGLDPGNRRFKTLSQAAEVLLDADRRAGYDAELGVAAAAEAGDPILGLDPTETGWQGSVDAGPPVVKEVGAGPMLPAWTLAVLALLTAATVAATAWVWRSTSGESVEEATRAAQAAAERAIVPVLSYDHETLDSDQKRAQSYLTSAYRSDYDQLFAVISENAPATETKVAAEVVASGIVRSGEDRVQVLVFVDRPTTNKVTPQPVVYKDQVTVTMEKVGEDWLVDGLVTSPVQP